MEVYMAEKHLEIRSFKLRSVRTDEEKEGVFRGRAAAYGNVDEYNSVLLPGCFRKSLSDNPRRTLLWSHRQDEPIGVVELHEDARGIEARGELNLAVARAREIYELMRQGAVNGMSIGFIPVEYDEREDGVVEFREARLVEVSLTPFPANSKAVVESVRSLKEDIGMEKIKEFEGKVDEKLFDFQEEIRGRLSELQKQLDAVDLRTQKSDTFYRTGGADFSGQVVNKLREFRSSFEAHGRVRFEVEPPVSIRAATRPATLPAAGSPVIGTIGSEPVSELVDVIPTLPISEASVVVIRENTGTNWKAAPAAEGTAKTEAAVTFQSEQLPIITLAVWSGVSKQLLDDVEGAQNFIRARLEYGLRKALEEEILLGGGTNEHMLGLLTQAPTWTPPTSFTYDIAGGLLHACTAVQQAGFQPRYIVLNPTDALKLRLLRDSTGQYVRLPELPPIIATSAMSEGTFLVFDPSQAVLRVKQAATVDVSESHADYFTKNLVAIRAEMRAALVVYSKAALLKGTITSSPAA
jgi:HK97 family phage prohead protease